MAPVQNHSYSSQGMCSGSRCVPYRTDLTEPLHTRVNSPPNGGFDSGSIIGTVMGIFILLAICTAFFILCADEKVREIKEKKYKDENPKGLVIRGTVDLSKKKKKQAKKEELKIEHPKEKGRAKEVTAAEANDTETKAQDHVPPGRPDSPGPQNGGIPPDKLPPKLSPNEHCASCSS